MVLYGRNSPASERLRLFIESLMEKGKYKVEGKTLKHRRKGELRKLDLKKLHRTSYSIMTPNWAPKKKC